MGRTAQKYLGKLDLALEDVAQVLKEYFASGFPEERYSGDSEISVQNNHLPEQFVEKEIVQRHMKNIKYVTRACSVLFKVIEEGKR